MALDVVNDAKSFLLPGWLAGRVPPHALSGTFILKGTFDLKPGAAMAPAGEPLPLNDEVFEGDDEKQSLRYPGDAALFKPKADLLLVGDCVPPGGRLVPVVQVEFSVGAWKKAVAVIGNRRWAGGIAPHPSAPEPFRAVPLRWENAYGGPGYKWNPIGKGAEGVILPNLEIPGRLITSKSAPPGPAGLGPIPRTWPQRTRSAGTCDGKWLKEDWPWLPRDFDWSTLNAAPADQQAPFLRGDEAVRIAGMHPDFPVLETRLPGIRPRWFVMQKKPKGEEFTELRLHLDTLWVDMKALQAVLVWRAVHPVSDRKLRDVLGHRIAAESLAGKPAPPEEHRRVFDAGRT
ncbi:MAG: DUF2169 domain-containing protein, partial [Planctomycetes bacterium]|nr:DUF2169 domain-containing protein [Planctomycetota bacterium]